MTALLLALTFFTSVANAVDIRETYPGTNAPNMSQPGYHIDRNGAYPTYPGTNSRDWSQPGYGFQHQGDRTTVYQTYPGTTARDWSKPATVFDED